VAERTIVEVVRIEAPDDGAERRHVSVRWSDGSVDRGVSYFPDEVLISEGDHGTSWLMSSRAEMHRVSGSVRAQRGA
jgi:hypothetical protein